MLSAVRHKVTTSATQSTPIAPEDKALDLGQASNFGLGIF